MISLPDLDKMYDYETNYHLTLDVSRLGKLIAHYEVYKMAMDVPGSIVECGVFKGTSLIRFALFRELFGNYFSSQIIAFDIFGDEFPNTAYEEDQALRDKWIAEAGGSSISPEQMEEVFKWQDIKNYELIAGDVLETIPKYISDHPELRISLLNIDIDFYESTTCCLEYLYDRVASGGVILLDNYTVSHGDTKSVDDFFAGKGVTIKKFPFALRPCYVVKE
jgi:hypothetical protein